MSNNLSPGGTRSLGWYAVRWDHITDWFKTYGVRRRASKAGKMAPAPNTSEQSFAMPDTTESLPAVNKEEEKLKDIVRESHSLLAVARSVFPFTLFSDLITIDRHKLTIVYKTFLGVEQTVSVPIENIKNIEADLGPFMGALTITSDHFINNTQTVHYLRRRDAQKIQKMVQGAIVAIKEKININKIPTKDLCGLLIDLGEGHVGA